MYARIVVALDGPELAERVLPYVEPLAEKFGSTLTLLRATTPPASLVAAEAAAGGIAVVPSVTPGEVVAAEQQDAVAYLGAIVERLRARGLKADRELPEDVPAHAIVTCALEREVDLIAMTTHGCGGLGRLVMGSVADEVLRSAPCAVLLVRVNEER